MNNWIPDQLFRYRGVSSPHFEQELKELKKNKVWLNFLDLQNDPFEGAITFHPTSEHSFVQQYQELRNYCLQNFPGEAIFPEEIDTTEVARSNMDAPRFSQQVIKQAVVASFSKSWNNTLMWGHYAEKFEGICLQFESDYSTPGTNDPSFFPVHYWRSQPPQLSGFDHYARLKMSNYLGTSIRDLAFYDDIANIAHEKKKLAVTSKSFDWVYEEEFRLVSIRGVPGYYPVPILKLRGVIFGPRTKAGTFGQVVKELGPELDYSKMQLAANKYGYGLEPISPKVIEQLLT